MRNGLLSDDLDNLKIIKDKPIILVADVPENEVIINQLTKSGIEIEAICDNIKEKSHNKSFGKEVIHTPTIGDRYTDAVFIIVSQQIQDCIEQLSSFGFSDFYSPVQLFRNYMESYHKAKDIDPYTIARIRVCIKTHDAYMNGNDSIYMRSLDVMLTTRCSLKCESCSNLMQYYQSPQNSSEDSILKSIEVLSRYVDEIAEFRLIGGEPLMNRQWHIIAKNIADRYPDQQIFVYSNGTIAPRDEKLEILNGKNVNFVITKYGELSRNIDRLESQLTKHGINFETSDADYWVDCSNLKKHNRSAKDNHEVFKQCCVKYLYTLLDGKLFRCPFIANAHKLRAIPNNKADYVDLLNETKNISKEVKRLIKLSTFFQDVIPVTVGLMMQLTKKVTPARVLSRLEYKQKR